MSEKPSMDQPAVRQALLALPEYERAMVEAMIFQLNGDIHGVGASTALEIIRKTCRLVLAAKRERRRANAA